MRAAWSLSSFDGIAAFGWDTRDTGTVTPASGSSLAARGLASVSASPSDGAARSRAVSGAVPKRSPIVFSTDV